MTSTNFTCGLDGSRNSSKVLKPPGGGSSDIFGTGHGVPTSNPTDQQKSRLTSTQNRLFGESEEFSTPSRTQRGNMKTSLFGSEEPAVSRSVKKPYVRRNPITGEEIIMNPEPTKNGERKDEENNIVADQDDKVADEGNINFQKNSDVKPEVPEMKQVQTSIRVRAPPGGKSSGIF